MIAPITPFISEEIYQKLTGSESVHLADFPVYDESLIDEKLEEKMDLVRNLISIGRMVREESKIKVRQPLKEILLDRKNEKIIDELTELIKEELNVKEIIYVDDLNTYMNLSVKPNFREVGKVFGSKINLFAKELEKLTSEDITKLQNNKEIKINLDNEEILVNKNMVEVKISSKEGLNVGTYNNDFVILNTEITEELHLEGLAREFVSKVQNLRKELNFEITDRINIYYETNSTCEKMFDLFKDYIKEETLALNIDKKENLNTNIEVNELNLNVDIQKAE